MWSAIGLAAARGARVGGTSLAIRTASRLAARNAPVVPSGFRVAAVFVRGFAAAKDATESATKKKPAAKKSAAKKKATKPKVAAKKPKKAKVPLSDEAKLKLKIKELQRQSLIKEQKEEAPRLPETSWRLFYSLKVPNIERKTPFVLGEFMALIAREFKSLPAAELEELSVKAAQNKVTNELALKDWVLKHPPVQIHEANLARTHLKRLGRPNTRTHKLHDDRIPVKFKGSFMYYVKSRANSADVAHMSTVEKAGLLGREWRSLEAAERKPFEEMAAIDRERYLKEKDAFIKGKKTST